MPALQIVPDASSPEGSLPALAQRINAEYEQARAAIGVAANHALAIGEMLVEAQTRVQAAGQKWGEWVAMSLPFGRKQAAAYLKLAKDTPMALNVTRELHLTEHDVDKIPSLRAGLRALTSPAKTDSHTEEKKPVRKKPDQTAKATEAGTNGDDKFYQASLNKVDLPNPEKPTTVAKARATYLAWLLKQDKETKRDDLRLLLSEAQITSKDFAFATMPLGRG